MTKSQGSGVGKYARKTNVGGEAAAVAVQAAHHQPYLGVRTRAKTLAIKRLQESSPEVASSYLQLRSRRLEKQLLAPSSARIRAVAKNRPTANPSPSLNMSSSNREAGMGDDPANSGSAGSVFSTSGCLKTEKTEAAAVVAVAAVGFRKSSPEDDAGVEASFGENVIELDTSRSARETTPCSLVRDSEAIGTPTSTTRTTMCYASNKQASAASSIPSALEMEELFAGPERLQQQSFIEKYNFDVAKDQPLPGRYEWLKLDS